MKPDALRMDALVARWNLLAQREKLLVGGAGALIALALVWWIAFAPALGVLRTAEAQHRTLDAQRLRMQQLAQQAQAMKAQPKQSADEAMRQLEQSIRQQLGTQARYTIAGDRVTVTLAGVPSEALAQWLTQARVNARALPGEARLARNAQGHWEGTLTLSLPPR